MHPGLWITKSGLDAQQTELTVISNNLANIRTAGFKKQNAVFKDLMYQKVRQPGGEAPAGNQLPTGLMLGTGVRVVGTQKDFSPGSSERTDGQLDMFINGKGFFQVLMPDGNTAYTRDGSFQQDSNGQLLTSDGFPLQPAITLPTGVLSLTISKEGVVAGTVSGSTTTQTQFGQIQLADFLNPSGLEPIGDNLYLESPASGTPTTGNPGANGIGGIEQGALETSNVNAVEELISLIQAQRGFEMNSKSAEAIDGSLRFATQVL